MSLQFGYGNGTEDKVGPVFFGDGKGNATRCGTMWYGDGKGSATLIYSDKLPKGYVFWKSPDSVGDALSTSAADQGTYVIKGNTLTLVGNLSKVKTGIEVIGNPNQFVDKPDGYDNYLDNMPRNNVSSISSTDVKIPISSLANKAKQPILTATSIDNSEYSGTIYISLSGNVITITSTAGGSNNQTNQKSTAFYTAGSNPALYLLQKIVAY